MVLFCDDDFLLVYDSCAGIKCKIYYSFQCTLRVAWKHHIYYNGENETCEWFNWFKLYQLLLLLLL
jgi:hypothetical protein